MAALPSTTDDVKKHLEAIQSDPTLDLDVRLVETFTAQLTDQNIPNAIPLLMPLIAGVLPLLHQDPACLTALLKALLGPLSFSDALPFASPATYKALLAAKSPPLQSLGLFLLSKASVSPSDVAAVASWNTVCCQLVESFLLTEDTGVAGETERVLLELLKADRINVPTQDANPSNRSSPTHGGSGLLWRRLFNDRDIYETILKACSWNGDKAEQSEKTTAQGRLMGIMSKIAGLDLSAVTANPFPELLLKYAHVLPGRPQVGSLLDFVTFGMIHPKVDDVIMAMLHVDFFTNLIEESAPSTKALEFLASPRVGKHAELIMMYYCQRVMLEDELDQTYLSGAAARYCAAYAKFFPEHILHAPATDALIPNERLDDVVLAGSRSYYNEITSGWEEKKLVDVLIDQIEARIMAGISSNKPPSASLHLLTCLPPQSLITANPPPSSTPYPPTTTTATPTSIITKIPIIPPNAEYITTLATLFSSSEDLYRIYTTHYYNTLPASQQSSNIFPSSQPSFVARLFWNIIVSYAQLFALKEICLASISLILQVAKTEKWDGMTELMGQITLMDYVFVDMNIPGVATSRLDPDSMAYKVSVLKFEIVKGLEEGLWRAGVVLGVGGVVAPTALAAATATRNNDDDDDSDDDDDGDDDTTGGNNNDDSDTYMDQNEIRIPPRPPRRSRPRPGTGTPSTSTLSRVNRPESSLSPEQLHRRREVGLRWANLVAARFARGMFGGRVGVGGAGEAGVATLEM